MKITKLLWLSQARFLLQTPWSTSTVIFGITLGVASVVAVHLISVRVMQSLDGVTPGYLGELSFLLEKESLTMDHYFALRERWRAGEQKEITALVPVLEGHTQVDGKPVRVVGLDPFAAPGVGLALAALPARGLIASGALGLEAQTRVQLGSAGIEYRVAAVAPGLTEAMFLTDIGTAQELLDLPSSAVSRVGVAVANPWLAVSELLDRLLPGFGAGFSRYPYELPGWRVRSIDSEVPSRAFAESVLFNLGALGSLALVVSWLLVYQVAVIWLRRRRRTMDMLQLQGVSRRELASGFLLSVSLLGALATVLGLLAGWLLGIGLSTISTAGLALTAKPFVIDGWVLAKAVASGIGVSLIGGALALRQEWRAVDSGAQDISVTAVGAGPVLWVLGLALLGLTGVTMVTALWGGFLAIACVATLTLVAVAPLLRWLRGRARRAGGLPLLARVGLRELLWYPRDLTVAIAALALAVATSMAIGIMVDSFRRDFASMLEQRLAHDLFVRGNGEDLGPASLTLEAEPLVTGLSAYGRSRVRLAGMPVELGYTSFSQAEASRYGWPAALEADQALASERLLRTLDQAPGSGVDLAGRQLRIVGGFPGFGDVLPRILVDVGTARSLGIEIRFDRLSIKARDPEALAARIAQLYPTLDVQLADPLRAFALQIFDQTFAITRALTLLALLVGSIGLYNALLAVKLNLRPTAMLLAAMGVDSAELRRVQLWRGFGISAVVLAFAVPLGIVMAWVLCAVINPRAFGWSLQLVVSASAVAPPLLLSLLVAVVTSLAPTPAERLAEPA